MYFVPFVWRKMLMYKLNWKACYLILCCHLSLNYTAGCVSFQCKVVHRAAPPTNTSSVIPAKPQIYTEQLLGHHFLVCQLLSCSGNGAHQIIPFYYHLFLKKTKKHFMYFFNYWNKLCGWIQTQGLANNVTVYCWQHIVTMPGCKTWVIFPRSPFLSSKIR